MYQPIQALSGWLSSSLLTTTLLLTAGSLPTQAQPLPPAGTEPQPTNYPVCQPPSPGEYLLLTVTRTPESQAQVQQLLPPNTSVVTCLYLEDIVTRVGGFRTVERANAWARYVTDSTGLAAYIARPAEAPAPSTPPGTTPTASTTPAPKPSPSTQPPAKPTAQASTAYSPKGLAAGYAVLVDYKNQPETAARVQQVLGKPVGLVAYNQQPFLLAIYTAESNAAYSTLQLLSDKGFWATLVDSRRVILLRPTVSLPRPTPSK